MEFLHTRDDHHRMANHNHLVTFGRNLGGKDHQLQSSCLPQCLCCSRLHTFCSLDLFLCQSTQWLDQIVWDDVWSQWQLSWPDTAGLGQLYWWHGLQCDHGQEGVTQGWIQCMFWRPSHQPSSWYWPPFHLPLHQGRDKLSKSRYDHHVCSISNCKFI